MLLDITITEEAAPEEAICVVEEQEMLQKLAGVPPGRDMDEAEEGAEKLKEAREVPQILIKNWMNLCPREQPKWA